MFADGVFKYKVVERGYALADYLITHPNIVVRAWERGAYTYYRYCVNSDRIMYRRPNNKCYNDWRIAYRLEAYLHSLPEYSEVL